MVKLKFYNLLLFLMISIGANSQDKKINIKFANNNDIIIDGVLDEPIWNQVEASGNFWQHFPTDTKKATEQTEIRMIYDDKYLYVSAKVYTIGNNYSTQSLSRDSGGGEANDNINFVFDTFKDRNNAFYFGVTPYGVVRDGLLSRGGVKGLKYLDLSWDTTWKAEVKTFDGYYTVEIKIPFFAFKFEDNNKYWRFNCYRNDPQSQINSSWVKIPRNLKIEDLGFMGDLIFEKPLQKSRSPYALIPYVLGSYDEDYSNDEAGVKSNAGIDMKVSIGTSSMLDLTINPDFSSAKPAKGSTNITRFELNLPERRQFFLDNSDLFANFGKEKQATPFYSRRIGYGKDTLNNDIVVPIIAGARFTGKINEGLRVGIIDVQTAEDKTNEIPTNNNLIIAVEQKVFKKSNISAIFINRQATSSPDYLENKDKYNRVFGLDYNYYSNNNRWSGKLYMHKSFTPEAGDKDYSAGVILDYNSRHFTSLTNSRYIGEDFKSDLGFIKRPGFASMNEKIGPKFYPKNKHINMIGIFLVGGISLQPSTSTISDYNYNVMYTMNFSNQSKFKSEFVRSYTYLEKPFDPTKTPGAVPLPIGDYKYADILLRYDSNKAKLFSYIISFETGTYYSGNKSTALLTLKYRIQPFFNTSIKATYDYITLPDPHPEKSAVVYLGPSFNFTFTKKIFWNTEIQFNSQNERMGIYSKVQWRYRPLSDIFLIYQDSYYTGEIFAPSYRSIFLKATFWLNI